MPALILPPPFPDLARDQRWKLAKNISGEDIPAFAAVERVSVDNQGTWYVQKPTRDDHPSAYLNAGARITKDGHGIVTRDFPAWAYYNAADGDPENGESIGTRSGFWQLHRGYEGFLVWGGADGKKVLVQSDLTCRELSDGGYYGYYVNYILCAEGSPCARVPRDGLTLSVTSTDVEYFIGFPLPAGDFPLRWQEHILVAQDLDQSETPCLEINQTWADGLFTDEIDMGNGDFIRYQYDPCGGSLGFIVRSANAGGAPDCPGQFVVQSGAVATLTVEVCAPYFADVADGHTTGSVSA